jgi:hypothetical protein
MHRHVERQSAHVSQTFDNLSFCCSPQVVCEDVRIQTLHSLNCSWHLQAPTDGQCSVLLGVAYMIISISQTQFLSAQGDQHPKLQPQAQQVLQSKSQPA